ncbi:hypothetical protein ANN_05165 [Periplaneta americana]|uniref:Uncharacterized protein n=1 Tax=Periplaneta americana TaxID=6978 RepID=A0ABQ8TC50_PERAM|nr:hypothetical protein ANN_05165 [Periplaneta americana]
MGSSYLLAWPPNSQDLTPPDFFVQNFVKDIVYSQKPRNIDDLKVKITQAFQQITPLMLQRTWVELHHHYEMCGYCIFTITYCYNSISEIFGADNNKGLDASHVIARSHWLASHYLAESVVDTSACISWLRDCIQRRVHYYSSIASSICAVYEQTTAVQLVTDARRKELRQPSYYRAASRSRWGKSGCDVGKQTVPVRKYDSILKALSSLENANIFLERTILSNSVLLTICGLGSVWSWNFLSRRGGSEVH